MNVFMIGGTGLPASESAKQLTADGHEAGTIALPPVQQGTVLPPEMLIESGNCMQLSFVR